jgi:hypothetical protein
MEHLDERSVVAPGHDPRIRPSVDRSRRSADHVTSADTDPFRGGPARPNPLDEPRNDGNTPRQALGLFKHFMDLIDHTALVDVPVALLASGGSDRHALVVEHQLRPLFAFFGAHTLPTGVFISDGAFGSEGIVDSKITDRLEKLVGEAREALQGRFKPARSTHRNEETI